MMKSNFYLDATNEDNGSNSKRSVFCSKEDRIFYIFGDINARNCADIAYDIALINLEDDRDDQREKEFKRKEIRIYINSYGGNVYDMWSLVDLIVNSKTPVHTICTGYAMSAAFQIFLAGHTRIISRHATLMYHQIYCWRSGKYQDLVEDRQHMDHLNEQIEKYVVERTKLTKDELLVIRENKRDTYFTADEAIELGIADVLIEKTEV